MEQVAIKEEDLQLFADDLDNLRRAGSWGKFIALFMALHTFAGGYVLLSGPTGYAGPSSTSFLLIYLLFFGLIFYLCTLMFQFSHQATSAAKNETQEDLSGALAALAMMFKTGGRLIIVYLVCIVLILLQSTGMEWPYS